MVSSLRLKSLIHFGFDFVFVYSVVCSMWVPFYSFACGCPVFPEPFIEETMLFPMYILGFFIVN